MKFAVLSSCSPKECKESLEALGYLLLELPSFSRLSYPVDTHADMLFFSHDNIIITHREYYERAQYIFDTLCRECHMGIILCEADICGAYPQDIAYNAVKVGDMLFSKTDNTSPLILKLAKNKSIKTVDTAQGYAACSTLVLSGKHVICADPSLSREFERNGIDVTKITNGSVRLEPYDYGFIGGCSGVEGDTVYFCGDIDTHKEADIIKQAIYDSGMKYVSLSKGALTDIGGIKFFNSK